MKSNKPSQDWSGLVALWGFLKRLFCIMTMSTLGAVVFGTTAWVLTCYVYGIGAMVGLPLGLIVGAFLGSNILTRDALVILGATVVTGVAAYAIGLGQGWDTFWDLLLGLVVSSAAASVAYFCVGRLKAEVRYATGLGVGWSLVAWLIFSIVRFMLREQ